SRQHFRIVEEGSQWTMQVTSKFGHVAYGGQPVQTLTLEHGAVFKLAGYDFRFLSQVEEESQASFENAEDDQIPMAMAVGEGSSPNLPALRSDVPFEGNDEATKIASSQQGVPYLRIVHSSGREDVVKLDGRRFIAGREEGSQIQLDDRKASRRQFELSISPQGTFVRDLGSSNGTQLNGMPLAPDELKPIRSGDVLQVGGLTAHFEVRDPHFEKRLMVVPPEVRQAPMVVQQPQYEMINYPVPSGPGGAVRVDGGYPQYPGYDAPGAMGADPAEQEKAKKKRFYLILAVVVIVGSILYFVTEEPTPTKKPAKKTLALNDAFGRLGPQAQQQVKELFVLSRNQFMLGKRALAAEQLRRLHEILPEGYENSLAMAEECRAQAEQEANAKLIQEEMKRAEESKRIVEQNLRQCEPISNRTSNEAEVRGCLKDTYDRDPGNPIAQSYIERVQRRVQEQQAKQANARDYSGRVARGRALHEKALKIDQQGVNPFAAMDAYKKHIASNHPDPDGLKAKSQANLNTIQSRLSASIEQYVKAAEDAYAGQRYKEAKANIKKAKNIDPKNARAAQLNANIDRELNVKLREIYEDAVIYEGLGKLDEAKTEWKKILELDSPDGEYYKRARNKMKAYGGI
ncbi:MAG: FHA domain-containing protein, partial [Bdellovibrionota bacterium]